MNLERDNSPGLPNKIGFVLSPSPYDKLAWLPEQLFEALVDPLMDLGHSVDASLPEPVAGLEENHFKRVLAHLFSSASFRAQENFKFQAVPINISTNPIFHLTLIEAYFEEKIIEESQLGVLWIDSEFRLEEKVKKDKAEDSSEASISGVLNLLLSSNKTDLPSFSNLIFDNEMKKEQIFHLAGSKPSLIKPNFKYYSTDILQEFGLTRVLEELADELQAFEKILVVWDLSSVSTAAMDGKLTPREVLQIANWLDLSLRRKNKLLALGFSGYDELPLTERDLLILMRRMILRIFGKTLFN
ncbi:MAG: hypothetical protein SFU25_09965 [Candidatus Caenarcaniphilales bacterium]|nr:hypothetical protein [Candidatus Caenarcaniphilales bacterium]